MSSCSTLKLAAKAILAFGLGACTEQLPDSFRFAQQDQKFNTLNKVNTKIDLLWVVDNSASMDVSQKALRDKLSGFATKYLKPTWDIRIGVITTDTFLANAAFQTWRSSTVSGSTGYRSVHLAQLIPTLAAGDARRTTLSSQGVALSGTTVGTYTRGIRWNEMIPALAQGADYAKLKSGVRDGPIAASCNEMNPYFIASDSGSYPLVTGPQCKVRNATSATGTADCLTPPSGETSVAHCVNTDLNNTVHSGVPMIQTQSGVSTSDLIAQFYVNVSTGSAGNGSERGLGSVLEFLAVNETTATPFFRADSLRGIIFLSDEDDQTMTLPTTVPSGFSPQTNYVCDLDALTTANASKFANPSNTIQNTFRYCCASGCSYQNLGCSARTIGSTTYKVGICPDSTKLVAVSSVKSQIDSFFRNLEGKTDGTPNWFTAAIVVTSESTYNSLTSARNQSDDRLDTVSIYATDKTTVTTAQMIRQPAVDVGQRYIDFANAVGNGSLTLDIGAADFAPVLDAIGKAIVTKKGTFALNYAPTKKSDMIVTVYYASGSTVVLTEDQFNISEKSLIITDQDLVLGLTDGDAISVNYQPSSLN
jgi:hypothetical protein